MRTANEVRAKIAELRSHQQIILSASAAQVSEWRHRIVAERREIATGLKDLSTLISGGEMAAGRDDLRRAVSKLRATLAEHQASWPAIAIKPEDSTYRASVEKVRAAFQALEDVSNHVGRTP